MKKILWKIRYYFWRVRNMDYKGLWDAINFVKERTNRNRLFIFIDMAISSIRYGSGYVDYCEFEFYDISHEKRATYLTMSHSAVAVKRFNDRDYVKYFDDKGLFAKRFEKYLGREVLDLREASKEDFIDFTKRHEEFMAKAFDQLAGEGIDYVRTDEIDDVNALYDKFMENRQFILEEFIKQDPEMQKLSLKSVNTIRMVTFIDDEGIPHLLVSALKSGDKSIIDNIGQGGMYTILADDGSIQYPMIDQNGNKFTTHPTTGLDLLSFKVPRYEEMKKMVLEASLEIPEVRYIGWDVALGVDGPCIIEGNSSSGPFQPIPSITEDKLGYLPLFEKYMGPLRK